MKQLELSNNYRLVYEENNVVLQFFEQKIREKIDKNRKKTGETEEYEFVDSWYFPSTKAAMRGYLNRCLNNSGSIEEVLERISAVEKLIEQKFRK